MLPGLYLTTVFLFLAMLASAVLTLVSGQLGYLVLTIGLLICLVFPVWRILQIRRDPWGFTWGGRQL